MFPFALDGLLVLTSTQIYEISYTFKLGSGGYVEYYLRRPTIFMIKDLMRDNTFKSFSTFNAIFYLILYLMAIMLNFWPKRVTFKIRMIGKACHGLKLTNF